MMQYGLDELALAASEKGMKLDPGSAPAALKFQFGLNKQRGNQEAAVAALKRLDGMLAPDARERFELADGYDQLGRQRDAIAVFEGLKKQRPKDFSSDDSMRLAWMYDYVGESPKALAMWKELWVKDTSPIRRKLIENRILQLAGDAGQLGDIAMELEEKMQAGHAADRDVAFLVRLYIEAKDSASAVEVIQEEFERKHGAGGANSIESLTEQARVYRTLERRGAFRKATLKAPGTAAREGRRSFAVPDPESPRGSQGQKGRGDQRAAARLAQAAQRGRSWGGGV